MTKYILKRKDTAEGRIFYVELESKEAAESWLLHKKHYSEHIAIWEVKPVEAKPIRKPITTLVGYKIE